MPRKKFNVFPDVDINHMDYHPALQKLRAQYSPDPSTTQQKTAYFTASDGNRLFTRHWYVPGVVKKGAIVAFHGMGGDSEYFVLLADQVASHGYDVYIHEYLGHGLSDGTRGDIKSFATYTKHSTEFLNHVAKQIGSTPLFALGESMGGTVLINTLIENENIPPLAGIMLFAPAIKIKASMASLKDIVIGLGWLLSYPFKPSRLTYNVRPVREKTLKDGKETIDPIHFEYDTVNPLHLDRISSRYLLQLNKGFGRAFKQGPQHVKNPLIVFLGGNDLAIDDKGVKSFVDRVPIADKEFIIVPEAPHAMFTSDAFKSLWDKVRSWFDDHAGK
nr:alpha/beta fold hydrolase [Candidatus Sigynarchaeota archaeon]